MESSSRSQRDSGSLELEAIAAVHELACSVDSISVSEILPRTADLIFVNVKTVEGIFRINFVIAQNDYIAINYVSKSCIFWSKMVFYGISPRHDDFLGVFSITVKRIGSFV